MHFFTDLNVEYIHQVFNLQLQKHKNESCENCHYTVLYLGRLGRICCSLLEKIKLAYVSRELGYFVSAVFVGVGWQHYQIIFMKCDILRGMNILQEKRSSS